jgi:hypothetical protein
MKKIKKIIIILAVLASYFNYSPNFVNATIIVNDNMESSLYVVDQEVPAGTGATSGPNNLWRDEYDEGSSPNPCNAAFVRSNTIGQKLHQGTCAQGDKCVEFHLPAGNTTGTQPYGSCEYTIGKNYGSTNPNANPFYAFPITLVPGRWYYIGYWFKVHPESASQSLSNWTLESGNIWSTSFNKTTLHGVPKVLVFNGTIIGDPRSCRSDFSDLYGTYDFCYRYAENKIYLYSSTNPNTTYSSITAYSTVWGINEADKGFEFRRTTDLNAGGIRWIFGRGNWLGGDPYDIRSYFTPHFGIAGRPNCITPDNCSSGLNTGYNTPPCPNITVPGADVFAPNGSGYSPNNQIHLAFDTWHRWAIGVKISSGLAPDGAFKIWIDNNLYYDYNNVCTVADAGLTPGGMFGFEGTLSQGTYTAGENYRYYDHFLMSDNINDLYANGFLDSAGTDTTPPAAPIGLSVQ